MAPRTEWGPHIARIEAKSQQESLVALATKGYAPSLPWDTMACSSDSELRRLAAALIPFIPDIDTELITNLARDPQMVVRRELAQSITNITNDTADHAINHQLIDAASDILRSDPSYRVRGTLDPVAQQPRN